MISRMLASKCPEDVGNLVFLALIIVIEFLLMLSTPTFHRTDRLLYDGFRFFFCINKTFVFLIILQRLMVIGQFRSSQSY